MEAIAACHIHSSWSYDGSWPLDELSAKFAHRGCRVLMMTEHDRGFTQKRYQEYREACAAASSKNILVVPGIEYSDAENRVHVLVWGVNRFLGESLPTSKMLEAVQANDGVSVLAHPTRKAAWTSFELDWAEKLLGIEVWNRKYDGWAPSKTAPDLLSTRKQIPFVGLDFHRRRQLFPLTMALEIDSKITEETVVQSLRERRCHGLAFGLCLTDSLLSGSMSMLKLAEKARRTAASLVRSARSFASPARP